VPHRLVGARPTKYNYLDALFSAEKKYKKIKNRNEVLRAVFYKTDRVTNGVRREEISLGT